MSAHSIRSPVLLRIFNRPDHALRVFRAIAEGRPKRLYLFSDAARTEVPGEDAVVDRLRNQLLAEATWPVEVKTRFAKHNLGSCRAGEAALDWFFAEEEHGIILEDDCVPGSSFFRFCDELLERFASDPRIMSITGNNFQFGRIRGPDSYYFSMFPSVWGWASWRRAWRLYDARLTAWPDFKRAGGLGTLLLGKYVRQWTRLADSIHDGTRNHWDYRWVLSCLFHSGLTITPNANLVTNIGFGAGATNTKYAWRELPGIEELEFPLAHPSTVYRHAHADAFVARIGFGLSNRLRRYAGRIVGAAVDAMARR